MKITHALMMKLVDTKDLKTFANGYRGLTIIPAYFSMIYT